MQYVLITILFWDNSEESIRSPLQATQNYLIYAEAIFSNAILANDGWLRLISVDGEFSAHRIDKIRSVTCKIVNND